MLSILDAATNDDEEGADPDAQQEDEQEDDREAWRARRRLDQQWGLAEELHTD